MIVIGDTWIDLGNALGTCFNVHTSGFVDERKNFLLGFWFEEQKPFVCVERDPRKEP